MKNNTLKKMGIILSMAICASTLFACGKSKESNIWETTSEEASENINEITSDTSSEDTEEASIAENEEYDELIFFKENSDIWLSSPDTFDPIMYTAYDFDKDGHLELVTSQCAGTGFFSENHFYKIIDKNLVELKQYYDDSDQFTVGAEVDFSVPVESSMCYYKNNEYFYPADDFTRGGATENGTTHYLFTIKDNEVNFYNVGSVYNYYPDENTCESTYYDDSFNEVSEAEYKGIIFNFTQGMTFTNWNITWYEYQKGASLFN